MSQSIKDSLTLREFIAAEEITCEVEAAENNPNWIVFDDSQVRVRFYHYAVTLRHGSGREMRTHFTVGEGVLGHWVRSAPGRRPEEYRPDLEMALGCLASDSALLENCQTSRDFAVEIGLDPDSGRVERVFAACRRQAQGLRELLGGTAYDCLLWHVREE